ncbi:MAG TPA: queuosine salvage family protein [Patescibacteria group bacterium]|nr:queuosine salvage family protein [Patescibacteria group bacterium]
MKENEKKPSYTDGVRGLAASVLRDSGDILSIDESKLEVLAQKLVAFSQTNSPMGPNAGDLLSAENELGLNLFLDVVNFCYKDPYSGEEYAYTNKDGKVVKRATGLKEAMLQSGFAWGNTYDVSHMENGDWGNIVQLEQNPHFYLGAERGKRIMFFARILRDIGFSKASDLVEFCDYDVGRALFFLGRSGYFTDEFEKRSQLAVGMMNSVLVRRFSKNFEGMETLTVMADYRLPQVMYNAGLIRLNPGLLETLNSQKIIETGSKEERALRAATVVMGKRLSGVMGIPEAEVDTHLWMLSQKMAKENELTIPHMIVATDKY